MQRAPGVTPVKTVPLLLALSLLFATGCNNECQQLCTEIADYLDHCDRNASGFSLPFPAGGSSVSECRKYFSRTNKVEGSDLTPYKQYRNTCRQLISSAEDLNENKSIALRVQFSCDEMQNGPGQAFGAGAGGAR